MTFHLPVHERKSTYNNKTAKIQSSFLWIYGISSSLSGNSNLTLDLQSCFTDNGNLSEVASLFLKNGWPYRQLILYAFGESPVSKGFDGIIQTLHRQNMYFVSDEDVVLDAQMLETSPIIIEAHLSLIDILMRVLAMKVWLPIPKVIHSIKKLALFSASSDLPDSLEDGVVLWLSKVIEKVEQMQQTSSGCSEKVFPTVTSKTDDLCDSGVLATILHFYCPLTLPLKSIVLKENTSIADALNNLNISLQLCYDHLFPHHLQHLPCFLSAQDFIHAPHDMKANVLAFYSLLYYCVEVKPVRDIVCPADGRSNPRIYSTNANVSSDRSDSKVVSVLPNVKSLLSEATKRSFFQGHVTDSRTPSELSTISNLQTTSSLSTPDVSHRDDVSTSDGPLLPRRHLQDHLHLQTSRNLPDSTMAVKKSSSMEDVHNGTGNISKWKTRVQPFYPDHRPAIAKPSAKRQLDQLFSSGTLLSKVDVDGSLDANSFIEESLGAPESSDFAWSGFTPSIDRFRNMAGDATSYSSSSTFDDDMKLETVRTGEWLPVATNRSHIGAQMKNEDISDSESELTMISTDLAASGDRTSNSSKDVFMATKYSRKSPRKVSAQASHAPLHTSYTVDGCSFSTADSAIAAGYPVISQWTQERYGSPQETSSQCPMDVPSSAAIMHGMLPHSPQQISTFRQSRDSPHKAWVKPPDVNHADRFVTMNGRRRWSQHVPAHLNIRVEKEQEKSLKLCPDCELLNQLEVLRIDCEESLKRDQLEHLRHVDKLIAELQAYRAAAVEVMESQVTQPQLKERPEPGNDASSLLLDASPSHDASLPAHDASVLRDTVLSYDTFSSQAKASPCHSTPAKTPSRENQLDQNGDTNDHNQDRKATGFTIVDESSPASTLAKKKELFLLGRLKKEEEHRRRQMEREREAEKRKLDHREQQEKIMQKKAEEREKREKILKKYQKRKQQEELHQNPGVIGSNHPPGSGKKNRSKTNHSQSEVVEAINHPDHSSVYSLTIPFSPHSFRTAHADVDDPDNLEGAGGADYTGPKLYKQLRSKSNRTLICNALCHSCLSGKVNEPMREKTLQALEQSSARHLMVLFRDNKCQFRALYGYNPDEEKLNKICGTGPGLITPGMIESLFKYNSGRRAFTCVPSKTLSVSIDAITIMNSLWHHASNKK